MTLKKSLMSSAGVVIAGAAAAILAPDLFHHAAAGGGLGAFALFGMTSMLTESFHRGGFVVSEADGYLSRENITIVSGQNLLAGSVLGKISGATPGTGSPNVGNTGNGTMGAVTLGAGAKVGTYNVEFIAATKFNVMDPNGDFVGEGSTGSAFNLGGVSFTITAGGTAFAAGDGFTIPVTANANAGKYSQYNPANTDGTQTAIAILYGDCNATNGDTKAAIMARNCEVNAGELVWFTGATNNQIATGQAQLALQTIIARTSAG